MTSIPRSKDMASRLERLERDVRVLQRASTLGSASISGGDLTVRGGGSIIVRDGGNITGYGDGDLDWAGDAHFGGDLLIDGTTTIAGATQIDGPTTVNGDAHFGGNLLIDGNTTLGGDLTWSPGVIPPEALSYRTEARTFGGSGQSSGTSRTQNVTVTVPAWAAHTSIIAIGISGLAATGRMNSHVTIDGSDGYEMEAASDFVITVPASHRRDFSPSGSFVVSVFAGIAGVTPQIIQQTLTVMAVFTN